MNVYVQSVLVIVLYMLYLDYYTKNEQNKNNIVDHNVLRSLVIWVPKKNSDCV